MAVDSNLTKTVGKAVKRAKWRSLPIMEVGDPVLRKKCGKYGGQIDPQVFERLVRSMRSAMLQRQGVGLAAPQVGIALNFAIMEDHVPGAKRGRLWGIEASEFAEDGHMESGGRKDEREFGELPFTVAINPSYTPLSSKKAFFYEGCLSLPGYQGVVGRYLDIKAEWEEPGGARREAKLHGWPARIFQHEFDHLSGILYFDKCITRSFSSNGNCEKYWFAPSVSKAGKALGFSLQVKSEKG